VAQHRSSGAIYKYSDLLTYCSRYITARPLRLEAFRHNWHNLNPNSQNADYEANSTKKTQ